MAFWGVVLKPGASKGVEQSQGDVMHLSQACLHEPKDGKNYLMAKVGSSSYALACLEKGKKEYDTFDLFFSSEDCVFLNKGQSEIHLTGYFEPDGMGDDESDESEDAQPPKASSPKASPKAQTTSSPKQSPKVVAAAKAAAAAAEDSDDDEDEEEESDMASMDEDEESEEEAPPTKAGSPKVAAAKAAAAAADDDSDDFEDEESEEESAPPQSKRGAPAAAAASPAKKAKTDAAGSPTDKWVSEIHAYLKKNGKKNLGDIGTGVQRPADAPKMKLKQLFEKHKDKFVVAGDSVTAK